MSQDEFENLPLPVVPIPVQSYSQRPVGRAGVVTFVGVTSIVIGVVAILAGVIFSFMDIGLMMAASVSTLASMTPATVATSTTSPAAIVTGESPQRLPPDALPAADRQTVADGLSRAALLSPQQLEQLDELLIEHGKTVMPAAGSMTAAEIAASVSSHGQNAFGGSNSSDYFVLGGGRLELSADRAVFFPSNGQPAARSNAIRLPASSFAPGVNSLSDDQIRSVLRTIIQLNGKPIRSAQMKSLIQAFQSPGQQIVVPTTDGSDPAWEVNSASSDSSGALSVSASHGSSVSAISCNADGTIGSSSVFSSSGFGGGAGGGAGGFSAPPTINMQSGKVTLGLTVLQLALAIYLLVIGILTLRSSNRIRGLHWTYVALKLPLAIATAAASSWMWNSLMKSIPTGGTGTPPAAMLSVAISMGAFPAMLGAIYPVVLIFMLMLSKGLRGRSGHDFQD